MIRVLLRQLPSLHTEQQETRKGGKNLMLFSGLLFNKFQNKSPQQTKKVIKCQESWAAFIYFKYQVWGNLCVSSEESSEWMIGKSRATEIKESFSGSKVPSATSLWRLRPTVWNWFMMIDYVFKTITGTRVQTTVSTPWTGWNIGNVTVTVIHNSNQI